MELSWGPVTDASGYVILWTDDPAPGSSLTNEITDLTETSFVHTGLTNLRTYRYRIVAKTGGGRGPMSNEVSAEPGPVPGPVEWATVINNDPDDTTNPGHRFHFAAGLNATQYRIFIASAADVLEPRRPLTPFIDAPASPFLRDDVPIAFPSYYRVVSMNGSRVGTGGPILISPTHAVATFDLPRVGAAFGDPNADTCLDLVSATGTIAGTACQGTFAARNLTDAGLADLIATGRTNGDSRFADFTGDRRDDLFSNTFSAAGDAASRALLHVNQGTGVFQTNAGVTALGIGGFGGTLLAADFDNDNDIDVFAPNDQTRGDGARNWLLINNGSAVFSDTAVAAGVDGNPAGADYVPGGGQAVDFNEDGRVDLLFGSRLLINNGNGTFSDGSAAAAVPVRADQGLKLADIDLDGDLDLIHNDGAVTRLYRNSGGVFDAGAVINSKAATIGSGLNVCDINSDGFEDVLIASNDSTTDTGVPRLLINVNGQFMPSAIPRELTVGSNNLVAHNDLIACGDIDSNGVIDIVARWGQTYRLLRSSLGLTTNFRIRVVGSGGERNQQGRIVRIVPRSAPTRILTRVIESGSGLRSQNQYDLLVGTQWAGIHDISVRFRNGVVNATAEPGAALTIYEDGRVVTGLQ